MTAWRPLLVERVRRRVLLEWDGLRWRQDLAACRAAPRREYRGTVLICDLMTMIASAKVESLIGAALEFEGLRPVVLLHRRDPIIEGVYRAACADVAFRYLEDYLAGGDRSAAETKADRMLATAHTIGDLVAIDEQGFRIGRNALSRALREMRSGRLDLNDDNRRARIRSVLADSLMAVGAARALVTELRPERALFNERGYTPAGEIFDACLLAGCDSIQWFGSPRSDSLMYTRYCLARRGDHPMALSPTTWERIKQAPWKDAHDRAVLDRISSNYRGDAWYNRQKLQDGKVHLSAPEVHAALGLDPARKTAVVFTHILYDATFFYGDSLFGDYEEWLVETVRRAIANPHLNWVIKVHPVNVWRSRMDGARMEQLEALALERAFGSLPEHVCLMPADTPINTASLFDVIDYGLTVRGTIGMELPCLGVPVVTAGTGRYSGLGFTIDPQTQDDYAATLAKLHERPRLDAESIRLARQHYHAALLMRPAPMRSFVLDFDARSLGLSELTQNTRIITSAGRPWLPGPDLVALAQWIASPSGEDFLQPMDAVAE